MIGEERMAQIAQPSPPRPVSGAAVALFSLVMCSLSLLVPIERGFPTLRIAGIPFRWPFVITVVAVLVLMTVDIRRIGKLLSTKYYARHALVLAVLFLAAARSDLVVTAVARALAYLTVFILNVVVLSWIFRRGGRRVFVVVLCWVAVAAAALGIAEGFFSYRPQIYTDWFANYQYELASEAVGVGSGYRVNGTLGNAILYAMAMILSIPFAAEIRTPWLRVGVILLLLAAAASTISKVVALALFPLCIWLLGRVTVRRMVASVGLLVVLVAGAVVAPSVREGSLDTLLSRWTVRLKDPRSAASSVGLRTEMAELVLASATDPGLVLFGNGLLSEGRVSVMVHAELGTIDNTYLNLFYETGLVGLLAYLYAFAGPLWNLRRFARPSLHYWAVVSLLMGSIAFVSYHYYTFNFLAAASIATLYSTPRPHGIRELAVPSRSPRRHGSMAWPRPRPIAGPGVREA